MLFCYTFNVDTMIYNLNIFKTFAICYTLNNDTTFFENGFRKKTLYLKNRDVYTLVLNMKSTLV